MLRAHRLAALTALVVTFAGGAALASHYRLPADGLVSAHEHRVLDKHGIHTTEDLLRAAAPLASREALARKTRLPLPRLTTLACQVDLLRVSGIGPSMVKLLQSGGVRHTRDLRAASPAELAQRLSAANAIHNIAPVLPDEAMLEDWIAQATQLEWVLEGTQ